MPDKKIKKNKNKKIPPEEHTEIALVVLDNADSKHMKEVNDLFRRTADPDATAAAASAASAIPVSPIPATPPPAPVNASAVPMASAKAPSPSSGSTKTTSLKKILNIEKASVSHSKASAGAGADTDAHATVLSKTSADAGAGTDDHATVHSKASAGAGAIAAAGAVSLNPEILPIYNWIKDYGSEQLATDCANYLFEYGYTSVKHFLPLNASEFTMAAQELKNL
jgi:hypothetical protein